MSRHVQMRFSRRLPSVTKPWSAARSFWWGGHRVWTFHHDADPGKMDTWRLSSSREGERPAATRPDLKMPQSSSGGFRGTSKWMQQPMIGRGGASEDPNIQWTRMEQLAKNLEDDAFGTLFGRRSSRLHSSAMSSGHKVFSTWGWAGRQMSEGYGDVRGGKNTWVDESNGHKSDGSDPSKHATPERARTSGTGINGNEDTKIDPITMRRVPKATNFGQEEYIIPVKAFKVKDEEVPTASGQSGAAGNPSRFDAESDVGNTSTGSSRQPEARLVGVNSTKSSTRLDYDSSELKADDLDELRPEDLRAHFGRTTQGPRAETAVERKERRKTLEADYDRTVTYDSSRDEVAARETVDRSRKFTHDVYAGGVGFEESDGQVGLSRVESDKQDSSELEKRVHAQEQSVMNELQEEEFARFQVKPTSHGEEVRDVSDGERSPAEIKARVTSGRRYDFTTGQEASKESSIASSPGGEEGVSSSLANFREEKSSANPGQLPGDKKKKDEELVEEVRTIYEDSYGVLNSDHRQPVKAINVGTEEVDGGVAMDGRESSLTSSVEELDNGAVSDRVQMLDDVLLEADRSEAEAISGTESTKYKVLAFDPRTQEMVTATTSSTGLGGMNNMKVFSPAEVLPRLDNAAQFLPYFASLERDGYEIVSGEGDVLVFKKVREAEETTSTDEEDEPPASPDSKQTAFPAYSTINPIDGTTVGNFASPTGFVNHDPILPLELEEEAEATEEKARPGTKGSGRTRIRREEAVYSGRRVREGVPNSMQSGEYPGANGNGKSKLRKTARRVFWVGVWVAGCSYAFGVVSQFFRTGGSDGIGFGTGL